MLNSPLTRKAAPWVCRKCLGGSLPREIIVAWGLPMIAWGKLPLILEGENQNCSSFLSGILCSLRKPFKFVVPLCETLLMSIWLWIVDSYFLLMKVLSGWKIYQVAGKLVYFFWDRCPMSYFSGGRFLQAAEIDSIVQVITILDNIFKRTFEWWKHLDIAFSNKQFYILGYFEFIGGGREGATNLTKGWLLHFAESLNTEVLVSFAWNPPGKVLGDFGCCCIEINGQKGNPENKE